MVLGSNMLGPWSMLDYRSHLSCTSQNHTAVNFLISIVMFAKAMLVKFLHKFLYHQRNALPWTGGDCNVVLCFCKQKTNFF